MAAPPSEPTSRTGVKPVRQMLPDFQRGGPPLASLEVDLGTHFHEPRGEYGLRDEPGTTGCERLVVGQHGVRVDHIEDIDANIRAPASVSQVLRDTQVDLVHAITPDL